MKHADSIAVRGLRDISKCAAFAAAMQFCTAASAAPLAKIEGGVQLDGSYSWTVTNLHSSAIVEVIFPHFLADQFHTPDGWKQDTTYLVNVGVPRKTGTCRAAAPSAEAGIAPQQKATFGMRMSRERAQRGSGIVHVSFADGTKAQIADVSLPVAPLNYEAPVMIGGFAAVLLIFILARRKRRKRAQAEAEGEGDAAE